MQLAPGARLSRYRIDALLGRGGMGEVYLGRDETLERPVAIKVVRGDLALDDDRLRRFANEARAASALNHPHIVHVYDVGEADGVQFIVMEYVDGVTLRQLIIEGAPASTLLQYLVQAADALAKAHDAGIVHRDLKPDNLLIANDGYAKVADFGLAKLRRTPQRNESIESLTAEGAVVGTPGYMAPEQVLGEAVDHRADIFAFGCILQEAVTGRRVFDAPSAFALMKKIAYDPAPPLPAGSPDGLQRIVTRCLQKTPASRYQSMHEAAVDLRGVIRRMEADDSEPTELRARPMAKRRPLLPIAAAAILIVITAVWVLYSTRSVPKAPTLSSTGIPAATPTTRRPRHVAPAAAYDLYMRGKVNVGDDPAKNDRAIAMLEQAVAADPQFAAAHAALAQAYKTKAFLYARPEERMRITEDAQVEVEKALALDPDLADAHMARAGVLWTHENRFPHDQAAAAYKRAILLDPDLDEAHHQLGVIYSHVGLMDKATVHINEAVRLNPANLIARFRLGVIAVQRGRCEEALSIFESSPPRNPSLLAYHTANALFCLGREKEAMEVVDRFLKDRPDDEGGVATSVKAMIHARSGRSKEAEQAIVRAVSIGEGFGHFHHTAYNIACAFALMNRPSEALKWLKAAAEDGYPCYPRFQTDPNLANLRNDPDFQAFLASLKKDFERRRESM